MSQQYILIDGQFHLADEAQLPVNLPDGLLLREEMRAIRNSIPFWRSHMELMSRKIKLLNQAIPSFFLHEGKELKRQIERTLVKNKLFKSVLIHFLLFKTESGFSYLLRTWATQSTSYELNKTGLTLGICTKITKGVSTLSSLDWGSEPFWKLIPSALHGEFDELILMNHENCLLEVPGKNIYLIKGETLFTPSPEVGAYIDLSQHTIRQICDSLKLKFLLADHLKEDFLLQADEVFLANSTDGIKWVKSFRNKRYHNKTIKSVHAEFNRLLLV